MLTIRGRGWWPPYLQLNHPLFAHSSTLKLLLQINYHKAQELTSAAGNKEKVTNSKFNARPSYKILTSSKQVGNVFSVSWASVELWLEHARLLYLVYCQNFQQLHPTLIWCPSSASSNKKRNIFEGGTAPLMIKRRVHSQCPFTWAQAQIYRGIWIHITRFPQHNLLLQEA